ncbi:hypothetical protein FisN_4Hu336 [Fistulifera solaris]|uniref:glucan endo-1,3-beta-D-glucosidase n=1 Tax=Fistulifera solaris TaxID=1519565 RepID=A0A1Z5KFN8_FISSO|nr:hypothetical protein FisN_4Hu336 [Fistulifera solaris]|eukprot:GAX24778.1 hypothetical protein FisN_4Hu336 [Fistulifera solaris]
MAYESVTLYGMEMTKAWKEVGALRETATAKRVEETGMFLTASEVRSARKYWHVEPIQKGQVKIFPAVYQAHVVGILWQTMAQLQTWFGNFPYLAYGIQLLPITPISESRDSLAWLESMYATLAESCESRTDCTESGWKILQIAALASVGYREKAAEQAVGLTPKVFEDPGGNGHSLSNTLWYIATRPMVANPIPLNETKSKQANAEPNAPSIEPDLNFCGKPSTCTDYVLDTIADQYSCRQRISWLVSSGSPVDKACVQVASLEFPRQCGLCDPSSETKPDQMSAAMCPPCTAEECQSSLNRCPLYKHTYVCSEGNNYGGCSPFPWALEDGICSTCCELTHCPRFEETIRVKGNFSDDKNCSQCSKTDCRRAHTQCPSHMATPYLCLKGPSFGGCSAQGWKSSSDTCLECCQASEDCDE